MTLYDKVVTAQGFCDRKDCKNCPCYERKRCTYLEEVRLLIDEQHTELQRLKGESNDEEEGSL